MSTTTKTAVLAFSGGLDTSYCVHYLRERGYAVHTVTVQTGGFSADELAQIAAHAERLGVASHVTLDETARYWRKVLRYLLYGNVLKNASYPLSVSAERAVQAFAVAHYARRVGADAVAHGSTGAGNDQVRFDLIFQTLLPEVPILTPIRDERLSRQQEIDYLVARGVQMNFEKAAYSINKGLWGTSVGGVETLTSNGRLPESAYPTQLTKTGHEALSITFDQGEPVAVNGERLAPVDAIRRVQELAGPYAIGRDIHVGDTIIGIKGRVAFEAAGPVILIKAHHALEKHTLTKHQLYWKAQLAEWYGTWLHEGQLLDPVMRDLEAFLTSTQRTVSGTVHLELHPYRFTVEGVESPHDLMSSAFGQYGEMNQGWTGDDVRGFAKIFGQQTRLHGRINAALSSPEAYWEGAS